MTEVLQKSIPYDVSITVDLPGISPLSVDGWLIQDEVFAAQMAERDRLIFETPNLVFADAGASALAKQDVLDAVIEVVRNRTGYKIYLDRIQRPDGVEVTLTGDPLLTAARLVQEDLCIHEKVGDEHVLMAAVLCFPASWTLEEKIGKPLSAVHGRVKEYDDGLTKRVQRLFDGIKVGRPMWRFNVLQYVRPDLFQPRRESDARDSDEDYGSGDYTRSEHQALVRMNKSGAVVFAIHTFITGRD